MAFTFPSLLETFHLIYPQTAYFSQSFTRLISELPFDWLRLCPRCLRHLLQVTAEDTATNGADLLMSALLGTCSPFSSEHQPCLNCIALDPGPLWCLWDTPVALRINTDSLVAFQLKCPRQKGNWIAVCQSNVRPRALFGCVWYMRGSGFVETGLDGYTGQRELNMCLNSPYLYMTSSPWWELDCLANKYTWISPGKELMVRSKRKLQDPTSMQRSWSEDPEVSWGFPSFHQRMHIYSFFFLRYFQQMVAPCLTENVAIAIHWSDQCKLLLHFL